MLEFLTSKINAALSYLNTKYLYEIRLRAGKPVSVDYRGRYCLLGERGIAERGQSTLVCGAADLEEIVFRLSRFSVYSVTEQLRQGFLSGPCGERVGIAGTFVYENGQPFTVKEITSLNVRIPHEIIGCAKVVYDLCLCDRLQNILIFSAPGRGKTTILRDLSRIICEQSIINVLISDERGEIAAAQGDFSLGVGDYCDVVRGSHKKDSLSCAVRALRPDVVITDEIEGEEDVRAVLACARSGVRVIASAHFGKAEALMRSAAFRPLLDERVFSYFVALDEYVTGKIFAVYDENFERLDKCLS